MFTLQQCVGQCVGVHTRTTVNIRGRTTGEVVSNLHRHSLQLNTQRGGETRGRESRGTRGTGWGGRLCTDLISTQTSHPRVYLLAISLMFVVTVVFKNTRNRTEFC